MRTPTRANSTLSRLAPPLLSVVTVALLLCPPTHAQLGGAGRRVGLDLGALQPPTPDRDAAPHRPFELPGGSDICAAQPRDAASSFTGTIKVPCVLIDFSDAETTYSRDYYVNGLYAHSDSMRAYFQEVSYGQLDVQVEVVNGSGGKLSGWVRAPKPWADYGSADELTRDAIDAADPYVDFSQYASGGQVPAVMVVWFNNGSRTPFPPLQRSLSPAKTVDGVQCSVYTLQYHNAWMFGVYAHELCHCFGAPDLYDPDWPAAIELWDDNDNPMSDWCLMSYGELVSNPAHPCGWLKWRFGWVTPTTLTRADGGRRIAVRAIEMSNGPRALYKLDLNANQYFLIENRFPGAGGTQFDQSSYWQFKTGEAQKTPGIVVYHIDTRRSMWNNAGWPSQSSYFMWVEDAGLSPDPGDPANATLGPLHESKAHAAFRSDGVSRIAKDNPNNLIPGLAHQMYPSTRDNDYAATAVERIDILSAPGSVMYMRVKFANAAPTLEWAGTPGYVADGVNPNRGAPNSRTFTFAVRITDLDGTLPRLMNVRLQRLEDGRKWVTKTTLPLTGKSGTWATGRICEASTTLPNGVYRYRFYAKDKAGAVATGEPATWKKGPRLVAGPQLWCTGLSGRQTDFIDPEAGTAGETRFKFSVQYTDGEGEQPSKHRIILQKKRPDGTWRRFTSAVVSSQSGTPRTGSYYTWQRKLTAGRYRFKFAFADADGPATGSDSAEGDATRWQSGPVVTAATAATQSVAQNAASVVSSLCAAPSARGAQVSFVLSAPASVNARVVNIAGRRVRAVARAKQCDAGLNMLVWSGQADNGLAVPNGTYLVEVTAATANGSRARALTRLTLNR